MIIKNYCSTERETTKQAQLVVGAVADGIYGNNTEKLVVRYQRDNGLVADGILGPKTMEDMGILDTDIQSQSTEIDDKHLIKAYYLPKGEYVDTITKKEYLFIHHTAGWNNPYKVIDSWGRDTRGRIATEFVIGGQNIKNGDTTYDGEILQSFPAGYYAYHLGKNGSSYMHSHSVGIELCNFGYLENGKTYVGTEAHSKQIAVLDEAFRGYLQWQKYSDTQLANLESLLNFIANRDSIDLREGLPTWIRKDGPTKAFEFQEDAYNGKIKGLLSHTNTRTDKTDCFPQPELVDMLLSL